MDIGSKLRKARLDMELTLAAVSSRLGMSQSNLAAIERGEKVNISSNLLNKLANFYKLPDILAYDKAECLGKIKVLLRQDSAYIPLLTKLADSKISPDRLAAFLAIEEVR